MSFSIADAAFLRGAAQLATGVAGRVSQAIVNQTKGFDEVLTGTAAPDSDPRPSSAESASTEVSTEDRAELMRRLTSAIRLELAKHSIDLNQTLSLRVDEDGSLRVDESHPQRSQIEALLNSDPTTQQLAGELAKATGVRQFSVDLTSSGEPAKIGVPGGYPNW